MNFAIAVAAASVPVYQFCLYICNPPDKTCNKLNLQLRKAAGKRLTVHQIEKNCYEII